MIKLSPNIRLSNHYAKGSMSSRIKSSEKLNRQIFEQIVPLFDKRNSCYLSDVKLHYKTSIPENKKVQVVPVRQGVSFEQSGFVMLNDDAITADYYILGIESRKKSKKDNFSIKSLPGFMHESTHILDYLLNPKYLINMAKMEQMGIFEKPYFEIYDKYFYNSNHIGSWGLKNKEKILAQAETETKNELKNIPFDEKLVFLNFIKYSMTTEYNAYNQEFNFVNMLKNTRKFASLKKIKNYNTYYHFPEKIEIVNKMIRETLAEARSKV